MYTYNTTPQENIDLAKLRIGDTSLEDYIKSANSITTYANKEQETNTPTNTKSYETGQVVGDTLGMVAKDVFTGLSKAFEGIADFGAGLVGVIAGAAGDTSTEDILTRYIERDTTNEYVWNGMFRDTNQDFEASAINKMSETGQNIVRGISQGVGGMIPTIAISLISRGAGASAAAASVASLAQMGISAAGTATEEALNDEVYDENGNRIKVSLDRAFLYGLANGAMEIATETIIGGAYEGIFGKGLLDGVVKNLVKNVKFGKLVGWLVNNIGEGVEEIVSAIFENTLKTIYNSPDGKMHWKTPDLQNVIESGIVGTLTAVVIGGTTQGLSRISSRNAIATSLQNINENSEWASNLQEKGRYDEQRSANVEVENERQLNIIEKRLKLMSEVRRAKVMSQMPQLLNYFNNDGTRIEKTALKTGVSLTSGIQIGKQVGTYDARITDNNKVSNVLSTVETRTNERVSIATELNDTQRENLKLVKKLTGSTKTGVALKVVVFQSDIQKSSINGFINDDIMYINKENLSNVSETAKVWSHENLGHFTEETGMHDLLITFLKKEYAEQYKAIEAEINNDSRYGENEKKTEIEARLIEDVIGTNEDLIKKLAERDANVLVKIKNKLAAIIKKLKAVFTGDTETLNYIKKLEAISDVIEKTLDEGGYKNIKERLEENEKIVSNKNNVSEQSNTSKKEQNSSLKPAISYSMKIGDDTVAGEVEEKSNLVALHNLREQDLLKVLELGGFPMPSIAVTTTELKHENYGDITVVFGRETIDPESDNRNVVYDRDAWTPTKPAVDVKLDTSKIETLQETLQDKISKYPAYNHSIDNFFDQYRDYNGEYILSDSDFNKEQIGYRAFNNYGIVAAYLQEKGADVEPIYTEKGFLVGWRSFTRKEAGELLEYVGITEDITRDNVSKEKEQDILDKYIDYLAKEKYNLIHRRKADISYETILENVKENHDKGDVFQLFVMSEEYFDKERVKDVFNSNKTLEKLQQEVENKKDFENWIWGKFGNTYEKRGIDNDSDIFDSRGNRRSFDQRHYTYTLNNIVRAMQKGEQEGANSLFGITAGSLAAKLSKQFSSVKDIREAKKYLALMSEDDMKAFNDKTYQLYDEIVTEITGTNTDDFFVSQSRRDDIGDIIGNCASKHYFSVETIKKEIDNQNKQYKTNYKINDKIANKILSLFELLEHIPTTYFEAKPRRVVGLNEIKKVLITNDTSKELINKLEEANIPFEKYNGKEGERNRLIKTMDEVQFSFGSSYTQEELKNISADSKHNFRYGTYTDGDAKLNNILRETMQETADKYGYDIKIIDIKKVVEQNKILKDNSVLSRRESTWGDSYDKYKINTNKLNLDTDNPIRLDVNGRIKDGNHRLIALLNAGYKTAEVWVKKPKEETQFSFKERNVVLNTKKEVIEAAESIFIPDDRVGLEGFVTSQVASEIAKKIVQIAPTVPKQYIDSFCEEIATDILEKSEFDLPNWDAESLTDLKARKKSADSYMHSIKFDDIARQELKYHFDTATKEVLLKWSKKDGIALDSVIGEMYEQLGISINENEDIYQQFYHWLDEYERIRYEITKQESDRRGRYNLKDLNLTEEQKEEVINNMREKLVDSLYSLVDNSALNRENILAEEREKLQSEYEKKAEKNEEKYKKLEDEANKRADERIKLAFENAAKEAENRTKKIVEDSNKLVEKTKKSLDNIKQENLDMKKRFSTLRKVTKKAEFFRKEKLKKYPDSSMLGDDGIKQGVAVLSKLANYGYAGGSSARQVIADFIDNFYNPENEKIKDWFDNDLYEDLQQLKIDRVRTQKNGKVVNNNADLSKDELLVVYKAVSAAQKIVKTYNQIQVNGKFESLDAMTEETVETMKKFAPLLKDNKIANAFRIMYSNAIEPRVVLKLMSGMQDNILSEIYEDICKGETKGQALELELALRLQKFYREHKKYNKSLNKKVFFRGQTMTKGQLLTLVKYYEQEHSLKAVVETGWAIYNEKTKKWEVVDGFVDTKKLISQEEIESLTDEELKELKDKRKKEAEVDVAKEMYDLLTEEDKLYLQEISSIMEYAAKKQIETDIEFKGYSDIDPANSKYYLPIKRYGMDRAIDSSKAFIDAMKVDQAGNQTINKKRIDNKKHLAIYSVDELCLQYFKQLGTYYGVAVPIKEFQRAYNYNTTRNVNKPITIRNTLAEDVWGYAHTYIEKLLGDIQGFSKGKSMGSQVLSKLRSGYVVASLGLNVKVVLTQFASYPTAFSVIGASSLTRAFTKPVSFKKMDEYSKVAQVRNALSDATRAEGADNTQNKLAKVFMKPISLMDRATIGLLWNACQFEVQRRHKGDATYKFGTEENMKEAAILHEEVVRKTQPNYTTTERTGIQRSDSELIRWTLGSFTSVPSKMLSRLVENSLNMRALWYREHKLGETVDPIEKRQIKTNFAKAVTAVTLSNLMYVLITQLMKFVLAKDRKDKEGKEISVWEDMALDFGSVTAGMIPIFKDLYSTFVQGYSFSGETFSMSAISDFIGLSEDFVNMVTNASNGKYVSENTIMGLVRNLAYTVSTFFGIPTRNVYNQLYGIVKRFDASAAYKMNSIFYSTANYSKDLKGATEKGDTDLANTIVGLMLKDKGMTNLSDGITDKIRDLYQKGYNVLPRTISDSATINGEEYSLSASQQKTIKSVYLQANTDVEKLISGSGFNSLDEKVQAKAIKWLYDYYYEYGVYRTLGITADSKKLLYGETMPLSRFALAISVCSSIESDKDRKGNTIAGSKKDKVIRKLRSAGMTNAEREIILAYLGYSVDENIITRYIRSLGLTRNQQTIFKSYVTFAA